MPDTSEIAVELPFNSLVDHFREEVKKTYNQPNFLGNIPAAALIVFENESALNKWVQGDQSVEPLKPTSALGAHFGTVESFLQVVVPEIVAISNLPESIAKVTCYYFAKSPLAPSEQLEVSLREWSSDETGAITDAQIQRLSELLQTEMRIRRIPEVHLLSRDFLTRVLKEVFGENNIPRSLDHPSIPWNIKRRFVYLGDQILTKQQNNILESNGFGFVNRENTLDQFMEIMNAPARNIVTRSGSGPQIPIAEQCPSAGQASGQCFFVR